MSLCGASCPRESEQQDPSSVGVIEGEEWIVRGALDPRHGNLRTLNVKPAVVPKADLIRGQLSVWRQKPEGIGEAEIAGLIQAAVAHQSPVQTLFALCKVPACEIRSILFTDRRAFCVVDECDCDQEGNKHPYHAHVAFCRASVAAGIDETDMHFEQARTELHAKFKAGAVRVEPSS